MQVRALTWNLFHGRDFPPDPALFTLRSRLLGITERNATHLQVNRDLLGEFTGVLREAAWDVALLQECPPRWTEPLATACAADGHATLTSRNTFGAIRSLIARLNPDLIASNEGGSNLTLARGGWSISERREVVLQPGPYPERRVMSFSRLVSDERSLCVANMHLSAGRARLALAERELLLAADRASEWAAGEPLILGGDLNIRPAESEAFGLIAERHGLSGTTAPDSLDHLLSRGLDVDSPPRVWADSEREADAGGLAIRLSDHAPVEASFSLEVT
jgi:endonuclease/exonuclease/phosphatase family metal-dependent hydrolase